MAKPIWYKDLKKPQQKRADKLIAVFEKNAAKMEAHEVEWQKLRRIAATNRTREQRAAKQADKPEGQG